MPLPLVKACCSNNTIQGGIIDKIKLSGVTDICTPQISSTNKETTKTCINVMDPVCNETSNISTTDCYKYCNQPDTNCDLNLDKFCSQGIDTDRVKKLTPDSTLDEINMAYPMAANYQELCACFMPTEYYKAKIATKYLSKNVSDILNSTTRNYGTECTDNVCSLPSNLKHYNDYKVKGCPDIQQLICDNVQKEINLGGTFTKSDMDFSQSINCSLNGNVVVNPDDKPDDKPGDNSGDNNGDNSGDNNGDNPAQQPNQLSTSMITNIVIGAVVVVIIIAIIMYLLIGSKISKLAKK